MMTNIGGFQSNFPPNNFGGGIYNQQSPLQRSKAYNPPPQQPYAPPAAPLQHANT